MEKEFEEQGTPELEGKVETEEIREAAIVEPETVETELSNPVIEDNSVGNYQDIPQNSELVQGIKTKWNWGAFSLTMWFGIAHRAYLGLLILLMAIPWIGPIFGLVWMIIFGFNGERWALENKENHYRDEEEFRKIMDGWNRAGLIAFIIGVAIIVLLVLILSILLIFVFNNFNFFQEQINQNYHNFNY